MLRVGFAASPDELESPPKRAERRPARGLRSSPQSTVQGGQERREKVGVPFGVALYARKLNSTPTTGEVLGAGDEKLRTHLMLRASRLTFLERNGL